MGINPYVILTILAMMGTIVVAGLLSVMTFLNFDPIKILKGLGNPQAKGNLEKIEDYMVVEDISPARTTIIRVPQYGYEFIINRFVRVYNGMIFLLQDNDIVYAIKDKSELQPDDEISSLRGDDYQIFRIENNSYKNFIADKMKYGDLNLTRYKKMMEESYDDNKEILKSISEMVKESRKSLYSQPQQQGFGFRRQFPAFNGGGEQSEDAEY